MIETEKLDESWISEFETIDTTYNKFYKESVDFVCVTFVYINDDNQIEHIKKDTYINPRIGGNGIQVGDWKFISLKNDPCDLNDGIKCNKLYIQDPEGSKTLIKEIESDFQ